MEHKKLWIRWRRISGLAWGWHEEAAEDDSFGPAQELREAVRLPGVGMARGGETARRGDGRSPFVPARTAATAPACASRWEEDGRPPPALPWFILLSLSCLASSSLSMQPVSAFFNCPQLGANVLS
jgi:hypothetical protein